jgi:hypothetical protein
VTAKRSLKTWRQAQDDDRCACIPCCNADPSRWRLREKRGFGVFNGNRVDPTTGNVIPRTPR